jgi:hypothetical protein
MPFTLSSSSITFPDGSVDLTADKEPILRYQASVIGNSNNNSAASLQYLDITCVPNAPCPIMLLNYDYWTVWPGYTDVYFSTYNNVQSYGDRYKTSSDNRDFIRCWWINGALGGPHIIYASLWYYD